jgi:hypothetical protein
MTLKAHPIMTAPARYRTVRRNGYQPAGMRVGVITLTCTGNGTDGQWLRVTHPNGISAGQCRAPAGLAALGIDLADLESCDA